MAVTFSIIGATIGEWLGAEAGLGYFSRRMMTQFDGAGVFAPIIVLSVLGVILFSIVVLDKTHIEKRIENRMKKWLAAIFVSVLLMGMLAACSQGETASTSKSEE